MIEETVKFIVLFTAGLGFGYVIVPAVQYVRKKRRLVLLMDPSTSLGMTDGRGARDGSVEVFGVPDTEAWWVSVHWILDQAERETIEWARKKTGDANACIAAVGAGEGIELVRTKLNEARAIALRGIAN